MPTIRQLPPTLVNKIAAGEVIERPASVVKELLENSIDAGARRIEVDVEKGGGDLIRISDDGCGIAEEQLPLAVASHATSKLPDEDALFHVRTLGFRGEALASIASVSQLTIRSRPADAEAGAEIRVTGGAVDRPAPCGCPVGTVIEARNLFFNTPVRRKFMRTAQTEMGHISEAFTRIALANPGVHMVLRSGARELYDLPPTERWSERIRTFFGDQIAGALIAVESRDGPSRVGGYVCDPTVSRGNARMQYLFLNGRHIRDRALQHALGEAYRGLLMVGRHPICFLRLELSPDAVDVNVHPTKLEVRFADGGRVYSQLLQAVRHQFLATDLTARVGSPDRAADAGSDGRPPSSAAAGPWAADPAAARRQSIVQWARSPDAAPPSGPGGLPGAPGVVPPFRPFDDGRGNPLAPQPATPADRAPWDPPPAEATVAAPGEAAAGEADLRGDAAHARPAASHLGFQVHNRYLITQDEKGMVVVDQHALHERVLYERIREKVLSGRLETQKLLVPEPVSLTPAEAAAALDARELLADVGIAIEPFGGDTVLISAYPAMLANLGPDDLLRQALESLLAAGKNPDRRELLDHLLHTIACKAAVKAGDRLTPEEITSLLEQRDLYQDTHHCPHGRPTALFFSRDELDRMFGRMGARKI